MESKQTYTTEKTNDYEHVKRVVEMVMGVSVITKHRKRHEVEARMVYSSMLREMGYSLTQIGGVLKKDHTTVIHYLRKLKELTDIDKSLLKKYLKCKELLVSEEEPVNLNQEIEQLKKQMEILRMENFILSEERKELAKQLSTDDNRLLKVFKLIEENTKPGYELIVERKIRKMFDD